MNDLAAVPSALFQQMTAQNLLMAALHHHRLGCSPRVIYPGGHHDVPPLHRALAACVRFRLLNVMRIVTNDAVAALAGGGAAHRGGQPEPDRLLSKRPLVFWSVVSAKRSAQRD